MPWVGGRYSVSSWSRYQTNDNGRESAVNIRMNGYRFSVILAPRLFENSPLRSLELRHCLEILHGPDWQDEDADNDSGVFLASPGEEAHSWTVVEAAFDWAVTPYLDEFEKIAPAPDKEAPLTLAQLFHNEAFLCRLTCVNDQFVVGPVEQYPATPYHHPIMFHILHGRQPADDDPLDPNWSTTFPCFLPKEIEVVSPGYEHTRDMQHIRSYHVKTPFNDELLFYKRFRGSSEWRGEIRKYERILAANLGSRLRILKPRGLVRDAEGRPLGLMLPRVFGDRTLCPEIEERKPTRDVAEKWVKQIEETVSLLHSAGIIWGNADPKNVLVDGHDDAWVVDFGEKHKPLEEGDQDPNTVVGDVAGVRKIRTYILAQVEEPEESG